MVKDTAASFRESASFLHRPGLGWVVTMFLDTRKARGPRHKSCSATPIESRAKRGAGAKVFSGTKEYLCAG